MLSWLFKISFPFARTIFFRLLSLCASLDTKQVPDRQHIDGSCLCLLPFCPLFSCCFWILPCSFHFFLLSSLVVWCLSLVYYLNSFHFSFVYQLCFWFVVTLRFIYTYISQSILSWWLFTFEWILSSLRFYTRFSKFYVSDIIFYVFLFMYPFTS